MEPKFTLDTDAIRKLLEGAIVACFADGRMTFLLNYGGFYLDLLTAKRYGDADILFFPTLIRPGDRCEVDVCGDWEMATYRGMTGDWDRPFYAQVHGDTLTLGFDKIRPLSTPVAETETKTEKWAQVSVAALKNLRELIGNLPVDCFGEGNDRQGMTWPIRDEVVHSLTKMIESVPDPSTTLEQKAMELCKEMADIVNSHILTIPDANRALMSLAIDASALFPEAPDGNQ